VRIITSPTRGDAVRIITSPTRDDAVRIITSPTRRGVVMKKPRVTKRGLGVSRTRTCKLQTSWSELSASDPIPFAPAKPLRSRAGIYVKYFMPVIHNGPFWIRGDRMPGEWLGKGGALTGYPLFGKTGDPSKEDRRRKQIFLPVTGRVPLYILNAGNAEEVATLEFA